MEDKQEVLNYIKESFELKNRKLYKEAIEVLYKILGEETDDMTTVEVISQIGDLHLLLKNYVRAIEQTQTIVRVPNSSSNIKGIINLRGEIIPVIDLKAKFGLGGTDNGQHELIIVNNKDRKIALEVDGVQNIKHIIQITCRRPLH